ncbi:TniB family NTP-binding protein [Paraburkholderia caribensis]|uniref:TniB family NTP-binding protein n=1 Tax=Paraburkholderia caribensis TaxID=75105 RepID=UPI001D0667F0|nr:TniB family NTP-binding protein [Paraburkholderia caribensis]
MKNDTVSNEIVRDIRQSFINFTHVKTILASLNRLHEYRCHGEEAEHVMLLGESGVGKSTLLAHYVGKHPRIEHEEITEIPVLHAVLGQSPTPKNMASTLLKALGDPKWHAGKEQELTERLTLLIEECRVRLVVIDETNHLIDRGGEKTLHTAADWLKGLVNETRVSFVLAGIPRTRRLLDTNDQLRERFREVLEINRFSVENTSAVREFRSALKAFKGYFRDLPTVDISGKDIARLFAFATDGRLRDIRRLLVRAVQLAYEQSVPGLTVAVLAQAFRAVIYPGSPDERNPFHEKFNGVPLVTGDEPFSSSERAK